MWRSKRKFSYEEKVNLSKKVVSNDAKAVKEYEKIMKQLAEKVSKGDQKAAVEVQEWAKAVAEASGVKLPENSYGN
ncbi:hypothetical protein [Fusobacterium ulcerans]|uniref:hypothetical protein n=1 Tax=Fusobacterium ulcerans TaxID=861 RepID=UPI001D0ABF2A|nr:hypothetical protein [Fusobacterium ulcerans]MCB8564426.1 hypothetical protein [Fusobacterium ulcerans]MCB8648597.1 hypothetical protein [Fusobacterium ulcerans]